MSAVSVVFVLLAAAAAVLPVTTNRQNPPNILFMMADQMRSDALSCAGNSAIRTPNLDKIASEGVRFANAFSSTPSCTPARAAILTGLSPWYHGMLGYGAIATRYPYELPRTLSNGGYYTCSLGKNHFGWNSTTNEGVPHGYDKTDLYDGEPKEVDDYDQWFVMVDPGVDPMATGLEYNDYRGRPYALNEYYHPTAYVGRAAVEFLETYNETKPFFSQSVFSSSTQPLRST
jgi:arylsulfatase A-like enzyme